MNAQSLILIALLTTPAWADVYKCPQADGTLKFQQSPCTITGEGEKMPATRIPLTGGGGLRESEQAYLEERDKEKQQGDTAKSARSGEVEKECMDMRRRIMQLEERENRGIHTWSKHGYEESHYRKKEFETLCGAW